MTTLDDVVQQVSNYLYSFTAQEQVTWLNAAITDAVTTFTVDDGYHVSRGVIEVEDELMLVQDVDEATDTITLYPFGRGYMGTTAAAHPINSKVTFAPVFPKIELRRAIQQTLAGLYPHLYQIKTTTFEFVGQQSTYQLPADCDGVVRVTWESVGPSGYWPRARAWEFHPDSELATGKAITLKYAPPELATIKVVYRAAFGELSTGSTTLADVGLPDSAADVLVFGACSKLVQFLDVTRLQIPTVENKSRAELVEAGAAAKLANQFFAMYMTRLDEERRKLLELNPPQIQYEG